MKIGNREINTEKINFCFNIISLVASLVFYIRVGYQLGQPKEPVTESNSLKDSVLVVNARLQTALTEIKAQQDSLYKAIEAGQQQLAAQNKVLREASLQIANTISTDWDSLSRQQQEDYARHIIQGLPKNPP